MLDHPITLLLCFQPRYAPIYSRHSGPPRILDMTHCVFCTRETYGIGVPIRNSDDDHAAFSGRFRNLLAHPICIARAEALVRTGGPDE